MQITYQILLADQRQVEFEIPLVAAEPSAQVADMPGWTRLEFQRCSHCPLSAESHSACPAAVSLVPLLQQMSAVVSHESVQLTVINAERVTIQQTTAQTAIGSLAGLALATSGCPYTDFFRPLARFHLPVASCEETFYRAISCYLVAQYLRQQQGLSASLEIQGLEQIYRDIELVNKGLAERLRSASEQDSMVNAVVLLDMLAKSFSLAADEVLEDLTGLFEPYLRGP